MSKEYIEIEDLKMELYNQQLKLQAFLGEFKTTMEAIHENILQDSKDIRDLKHNVNQLYAALGMGEDSGDDV